MKKKFKTAFVIFNTLTKGNKFWGDFEMSFFETYCPHCDMVYAVTPCHAFDPENVMAAGIGY